MPEKYIVTIDDEYSEGEELAWNKTAFTSNPAVKVKGMAFSTQQKMKYSADKPKMRIAAPAIIPMTIYRNQDDSEFYVEFTPAEIEKIFKKFMKNIQKTKGGLFNLEHTDEEVPAYILEIWMVEDPEKDKSYSVYGQKLPKGTLFIVSQITDEAYFNSLVENDQLGYSIEGIFGLSLEKPEEKLNFSDEVEVEKAILGHLREVGMKTPEHWVERTEDEYITQASLALSDNPTDEESYNDRQDPAGGGQWLVRYKYTGPVDEKTREFCAELVGMDKIYTQEEIENGLSNPEFGNYSIFDYKGSYGCRHKWQRMIFYEDYEANKVNKVGNVPAVTTALDDEMATTFNAELSANNKTEIMNKQKVKSVTELNLGAVYNVSRWETIVDNETFAVGDVVTYTYDGQTYNVGVGEYELEDGNMILTDSKGVIRFMGPRDESASVEETPADTAELELADAEAPEKEEEVPAEEPKKEEMKFELDDAMKADIEALFADKFDEIYKMIADIDPASKVEKETPEEATAELNLSLQDRRTQAALAFAKAFSK